MRARTTDPLKKLKATRIGEMNAATKLLNMIDRAISGEPQNSAVEVVFPGDATPSGKPSPTYRGATENGSVSRQSEPLSAEAHRELNPKVHQRKEPDPLERFPHQP